jgi:hypothetical protein
LVGSLPPDLNPEKDVPSPADVQEFLAKYLQPGHGDVIGGGEARPDQQVWLASYSNKLAKAVGTKGLRRYSSEPWHFAVRLAKGLLSDRRMTADKVPVIGFGEWGVEDHKAFSAQNYDDATFMVGLGPVTYQIFSGAMYTDTKLLEDKIVDEIWHLYRELGEEEFLKVVLQFEVPFKMWADAMLPEGMEAREEHYATRLKSVQRIILRSPKGTRFSFHLCWGDPGGRPAVHPSRQKVGTKVAMINAIASLPVWGEYVLFAIHDPFGDGVHAPHRLTEAEFRVYSTALRRLPEGTHYAIGILHNRFSDEQIPGMAEDVQQLMRILRTKDVKAFYLSTHCGVGDKTVRDTVKIFQQYRQVKELLQAT